MPTQTSKRVRTRAFTVALLAYHELATISYIATIYTIYTMYVILSGASIPASSVGWSFKTNGCGYRYTYTNMHGVCFIDRELCAVKRIDVDINTSISSIAFNICTQII